MLSRPRIIIIATCIILAILAVRLPIGRPFSFLFQKTFAPIQAFLYRQIATLKTHPLFNQRAARSAMEERDTLQHEVTTLAEEVGRLRFAAEENKTLRQLLKFREEHGVSYISARVLLRRTVPGTFAVVLDRGSRDGVEVGMPVVTNNAVLVGKILSVREHVSDAVFLADARFRAAGTLSTSLETSGYVRGEAGVSILMELIPSELAVKAGDLVVTSGLEPGIPRGLVLGAIERTIPGASQLFNRAFLTSVVPLASITDVAIIVPPEE